MEEKKILAIFGGSFNPPLNSHFSLAQQIVNEYENIEKVIFVPVNSKYQKEGLLENEHRYNMLKLVCNKNSDFIVSDIELKQQKQLYTIETLELLQKEYPNNILCFTIGTDNLKGFSKWESADKLVNKFKILVLERDEDDMNEIIEKDNFLLEHKKSFIKLKRNIRYLTPDEVYYYIKENNLY